MLTEVRLANTQPRTVIHDSYGVLVKTEANVAKLENVEHCGGEPEQAANR